ncbi:uncharacterized protein Dyak_GE27950, isoform A [Drosophila yakuba]|uniref:Uncharacterized protein, isoform A n=1 Tax=Drosophila yakuba TaxID=7245 RepID=A0A0R1E8X9_DROYA|nr:uncharacterized protein Dyak_GE27950, isoform A [Drosophila yakuba]
MCVGVCDSASRSHVDIPSSIWMQCTMDLTSVNSVKHLKQTEVHMDWQSTSRSWSDAALTGATTSLSSSSSSATASSSASASLSATSCSSGTIEEYQKRWTNCTCLV